MKLEAKKYNPDDYIKEFSELNNISFEEAKGVLEEYYTRQNEEMIAVFESIEN